MTVGYGDIVPVTNPEKVFVTVITYLVTGVFGYVITTIGSVIYRLRELENQYQSRIRIINKIINARGLPNELQFKVTNKSDFRYVLTSNIIYMFNKNNKLISKSLCFK